MTNHNMRVAGTFRANRSGFKTDNLQLPKDTKRGDYERLLGNMMGMVIKR